jgi:hypothetical protein
MKSFMLRVASRAIPVVVVALRILFAEGRSDLERAFQGSLRTFAQNILKRYQEV